MELPTYFLDFLQDIRPTPAQRQDYRLGHTTLRERLEADTDLKEIIVHTFLQGSYRRATAVRPLGTRRPDVDVIVVTTLDESEYTPEAAMRRFEPFLEQHYQDKYEYQGRSISIELADVALDLVVTSAPSEAEQKAILSEANRPLDLPLTIEENYELLRFFEAAAKGKDAAWKLEPLRIPDREARQWQDTHPLAQIRWTVEKNAFCSKHYVNVVKALKWWRQGAAGMPKYPKSYPFEHLVGQHCPDGITSVAVGITRSLESIADLPGKPWLPDHGVPNHDVLLRVSESDFTAFLEQVRPAAKLARRALDEPDRDASAHLWHELLGDPFPKPDPGTDDTDKDGGQGYSERTQLTIPRRGRFGAW